MCKSGVCLIGYKKVGLSHIPIFCIILTDNGRCRYRVFINIRLLQRFHTDGPTLLWITKYRHMDIQISQVHITPKLNNRNIADHFQVPILTSHLSNSQAAISTVINKSSHKLEHHYT